MIRKTLLAALAVLAGCAVQKPMTPEVAQTLKGKQGVTLTGKTPNFAAMTAGKAMFGMFGAAAMLSAGNEIVRKNGVQDPAPQVAAELARALGRGLGVNVATRGEEQNPVYPETIGQKYPNADLVLDVQTTEWWFGYFPSDWSHYRVNYVVRARLLDPKTKQVLAEGTAKHIPEQTPDAPTYDELLASNAARLKAELNKAAAACTAELLQKIFKL